MLKILLVGIGSIGSKHLHCLQKFNDLELAALRTSKGSLKENTKIQAFYNFKDALNFKPDGVIITNPTALHVESSLFFLQQGIKVLIEKPVAQSSTEGNRLLPYHELLRIAYCMRFHPINDVIKSILLKEKVFKVGFKRSFYLPKWHPYADYRFEYTAQKELGGGVIRTLSHEIDLMLHWFGNPKSIIGAIDKVSNLEIDTDDYAFFTCGYHQGFRVNFELDFFSPVNVNNGELFTDKGKYQWSMSEIGFTPYNEVEKQTIVIFAQDEIDEMYFRQMADFINFVKVGKSKNSTLNEGLEILKIIEKLDSKA